MKGNNVRVRKRFKVVLFLFVLLSFIGFSIGSRHSSFATAEATKANSSFAVSSPAATEPREVYMQNCARCHGADGKGKTALGKTFKAPDLTTATLQRRSNSRLTRTIKNGRGNMPGFAKKLSIEDINALVAFVRSFKK